MDRHLHIITPRVARLAGLKRYFTGKPCRNGHLEERLSSNKICLGCARAANKLHYQSGRSSKHTDEGREKGRLADRRYLQNNREAIGAKRRSRYLERQDEMIARRRAYYEKNLPKIIAQNAVIKQRRSKRAPNWLSEEQMAEIEALYIKSDCLTKATGVRHHVDHIVPLLGKLVCGLHVPWNLRVVTATENLRKGNDFLVH